MHKHYRPYKCLEKGCENAPRFAHHDLLRHQKYAHDVQSVSERTPNQEKPYYDKEGEDQYRNQDEDLDEDIEESERPALEGEDQYYSQDEDYDLERPAPLSSADEQHTKAQTPPGSTMEAPPPRRDINELLTAGYFKTSRGKSPSGFVIASSLSSSTNICPRAPTSSNTPLYLSASYNTSSRTRSRSRSYSARRLLPPPPFVEDELKSLARESSASKND